MSSGPARQNCFEEPKASKFVPSLSTPNAIMNMRDVTREAFIEGMRQVASPLAVVTTSGATGLHGATVSAFCSVSADPPTLLVCLRNESRICAAVEGAGVFTLNILAEKDQGLARVFAGELDTSQASRFKDIRMVDYGRHLAPGIQGTTCFACRVVFSEIQHSHMIFVGEVAYVEASGKAPLTYHDGGYCGVHPISKRTQPDSTE